MADAGELVVQLRLDGGHVLAAAPKSSRPQASQVLVGRSAEDAVRWVPRLFSICGMAQGVASRLATAAAQGREADLKPDEACALAVEACQEHLWRLLLDWPALLGLPQRREDMALWFRRLASTQSEGNLQTGNALTAWVSEGLMGGVPLDALCDSPPAAADCAFAQVVCSRLPHEAHAAGPGSVLLGEADVAALSRAPEGALEADFSMLPQIGGAPRETGAVARMEADPAVAGLWAHGQRVRARLVGRWADLLCTARALALGGAAGWAQVWRAAPGIGLARVETARGTLLHVAEVVSGQVARYAVIAPTEWNFHPQGAVTRELVGQHFASAEEALQRARCLVQALDPCVAWRVETAHA